MLRNVIVVLIILQIVPSFVCANEGCPYEESTIYGTRIRARWISEPTVPNQVVISVPTCIDTHNVLITRICANGSWVPKSTPVCRKEWRDLCPDNFQLIDDYCIDKRDFFPKQQIEFGHKYSGGGENYSLDANSEVQQSFKYFPKSAQKYNCEEDCLPSDFGCYCKIESCETLATIKTSKDLKIIKELADGETCQIGETNYTGFVSKESRLFINGTTIFYRSYRSNCTICFKQGKDFNTRLVLTFEERRRKLYLQVYSPENLIRHNNRSLIFCYTNADENNVKDRAKEELIVEKRDEFSVDVYRVKIQKYMGEYWCEALFLNHTVVSSNRIIAYDRKKGNEYALRAVYRNVCKTFTCDFVTKMLKRLEKVLNEFDPVVRLMEIFNFDTYQDVADVLVHISTRKKIDVVLEYPRLQLLLRSLSLFIEVKYLKSSEFCPQNLTKDLTWPLTTINNAALSEEFCLLSNGIPLVRHCEGNFLYGAEWSPVTDACFKNFTIPTVTRTLKKLSKSHNVYGAKVWATIKNENLSILDMYYLGIILRKLQPSDGSYALGIVSKMMSTNETVLKVSQNLLNLTDIALVSIEDLLENITLDPTKVHYMRTKNLIVHINNPFLTNITGLIVYGGHNTTFDKFSVTDFSRDDDFDNAEKENLLLGVYFSDSILEHILNETESTINDISIITTIFHNDSLFIDDNYQSKSFVISVSIPGYGSYLETPIPIIFRSKNHKNDSDSCGFWDYGQRANHKKGQWSLIGSIHHTHYQDLHTCSYVHLTHFALLVMSDNRVATYEDEGNTNGLEEASVYIYEIVTIVGCSISIFGICGIFVTAICFEKWRRKIGTKILLNLAVAILLEIICIHLSEISNIKLSNKGCKILGMILHYIVLSKFCWMLVYALLQYYRFVKVIGAIPQNLILKSVIFGWGLPLVIVSFSGLLTDGSYASVTYELCYPRGSLLYSSVLFPVALIIVANLVIFCMVMYNVTKTTSFDINKPVKLRVYLAFLLFWALGIPWVFAILAEILNNVTIKFILFTVFCATATLQGFIMFLFYVIMNKETRQYWLRYVRAKV